MIGRPERRIFGGAWSLQDAGFQISRNPDGTFAIEAGTLVGVTTNAIVGIKIARQIVSRRLVRQMTSRHRSGRLGSFTRNGPLA